MLDTSISKLGNSTKTTVNTPDIIKLVLTKWLLIIDYALIIGYKLVIQFFNNIAK